MKKKAVKSNFSQLYVSGMPHLVRRVVVSPPGGLHPGMETAGATRFYHQERKDEQS